MVVWVVGVAMPAGVVVAVMIVVAPGGVDRSSVGPAEGAVEETGKTALASAGVMYGRVVTVATRLAVDEGLLVAEGSVVARGVADASALRVGAAVEVAICETGAAVMAADCG